MRRLALPLAGAVLLVLVGSGCGPDRSGSLGPVPTDPPPTSQSPGTPSPPAPTGEPASPEPADRSLTIEVWFTRDGTLFPTTRTRPVTLATSRLALTELIAGPTAPEAAAGVRSELPAGTDFDVSIADSVATVDLPASFDDQAGSIPLQLAQITYTLTQFATVSAVAIQVGGRPLTSALGRANYEDLLPPIVVTSPVFGDRVSSPVTVAGTANVFEATVSIRILDAAGAPLATTFTTATCGSGCRGDYSTAVSFDVATEQRGTVQVYEVSAEDGSSINVVNLPVTLVPGR